MAIVDLVQRSEAWFDWRKKGITASMIPVIMGLSPYQTAYQLWAEFVGLKEPDDLSNNYHVQRGVAQEPEARDAVESEYGKPYMPVCVEADHNPLFKASLDGLYKKGAAIEVLEIKCPCEKIYNEILALKGQAPTFQMYAAQVQWQLNCSGATNGKLYFYLRGKRPISTNVKRNDAFIAKAEERALWFWNLIQTKTPPPLIEGRDKEVYELPIKDNTWEKRVAQYREKASYLASMEAKVKAVKADLKQLEQYFTSKIPENVQTFDKDGIRATRVERNGSIDYPKLLSDLEAKNGIEISQEHLESYRKKGTSYFRISTSDQVVQNEQPESEQKEAVQNEPSLENVVTNDTDHMIVPPEKVEATTEVEEPELIHPLPASNFFEKSTSNVFF